MKIKLQQVLREDIEYTNEKVYDLTVAEDHSYCANNYIVHNSSCLTRVRTGI